MKVWLVITGICGEIMGVYATAERACEAVELWYRENPDSRTTWFIEDMEVL
jgi:hypothetical protein